MASLINVSQRLGLVFRKITVLQTTGIRLSINSTMARRLLFYLDLLCRNTSMPLISVNKYFHVSRIKPSFHRNVMENKTRRPENGSTLGRPRSENTHISWVWPLHIVIRFVVNFNAIWFTCLIFVNSVIASSNITCIILAGFYFKVCSYVSYFVSWNIISV